MTCSGTPTSASPTPYATSSSDWGLAITMDVKTCQIVQMSQAPTFNPDTRTGMNDFNTVSRAVSNVYEPGSVLKTITMAALADQGKIAADTPIVVPSGVTIDKFKIGDYWEHGTLHLTAAGVIAKSSNLGTLVAAQKMSDETMHSYLRKFGFGETVGRRPARRVARASSPTRRSGPRPITRRSRSVRASP